MAVRIPIEADAQNVLNAFTQIREAIRRTGQEGTAFQDLDFSHPELRDLENDVRRVQHQFEELGKVGRGRTASAVRQAIDKNSDVGSWLDGVGKVFPDEVARQRHLATVGNYVFQGTQFAAPPPAPSPSPSPAPAPNQGGGGGGGGGGGDNGGGGGGGFFGGGGASGARNAFANRLKIAGEFAVGATIGEDILKGIVHAYEGAKKEDTSNDSLYRRIDDTSTTFDQLKDRVRGLADALNVTDNEAQNLAATWVRLGRHESSDAVARDTQYAGRLARGYGVDPGSMVASLARGQMLGQDPHQFALLIADAVHQSGQNGQIEETTRALLRWTETAQRQLVTHSNTADFAELFAAMTRTGAPGLMGANGEALIGQLNSAITSGGSAGPAGQAVMMRALMRYGMRDPYDMQFQLSGGAFERVGKSGQTNLSAVLQELQREFPHAKPHEFDSVLSSLFGINPRQADALMHIQSAGHMSMLSDAAKAAGVDLTKVDPGAFQEMENAADPQANLRQIAARLLARKGDNALDPTDVARLQGAEGGQGDLRSTILQVLARAGGSGTLGNQVQKADADLSNQLQRAASSLVEPMSGLRDQAAALLTPITAIAKVLSDTATTNIDFGRTAGASKIAGEIEGAPSFFSDAMKAAHGDRAALGRVEDFGERFKEENLGWLGLWSMRQNLSNTPELLSSVHDRIIAEARRQGVDPASALALARTEGGGLDLTSPAGAVGAMQLMPRTAAGLGVTNIHDLGQNVAAGVSYFAKLTQQFHGDLAAAVAAYNAGPNKASVREFAKTHNLGVLPVETQREVIRFARNRPGYAAELEGGTQATGEVHVYIHHPDGTTQKKTATLRHAPAPNTGARAPLPSGAMPVGTPWSS